MRRRIVTAALLLLAMPLFVAGVSSLHPDSAVYVMTTNSMQPTIPAGSLVIVTQADSYSVGQVVTVERADRTVTHRIVDRSGDRLYTRGDANDARDPEPVTAEAVRGRVVATVPLYGYLVGWIRSPLGYLLTVLVPGLWLLRIELARLRDAIG